MLCCLLQANAAGLAWERLYHDTWRTNTVLSGASSYNIRGFKGNYTATIKHQGKLMATTNFTLTDVGKNLKINLGMLIVRVSFKHVLLQILLHVYNQG